MKIVTTLLLFALASAFAQDPLQITFTHHSSASNTFWQAVQRGMNEACELVEAQCDMLFTQTEGDANQQLANIEAALARGTDVLVTTIVDDNIFDDVLAQAQAEGVIVLASNVDDSEGAAGNTRLAFIGQDFRSAGYELARGMSELFPAEGPIHVLVGISAPGQNWSETRGGGVLDFMAEYQAANPERDITFERIDSGTDLAVTASRIGAYVQASPDLTAYFDTGYWHAGVARELESLGYEPGEILLGGFDLVPDALQGMQNGYIQLQVDQQPYLQGFLPIIQAHLMNKYQLSAWDVNTGKALIEPADVEAILELSQEGYR